MKTLEKLIDSMPTEKDIDGNVINAPVFIGEDDRGNSRLVLSAENETSFYFADYYGEFRDGYPWVNPALEAWAKDRGYFWEWMNPGALALVKA